MAWIAPQKCRCMAPLKSQDLKVEMQHMYVGACGCIYACTYIIIYIYIHIHIYIYIWIETNKVTHVTYLCFSRIGRNLSEDPATMGLPSTCQGSAILRSTSRSLQSVLAAISSSGWLGLEMEAWRLAPVPQSHELTPNWPKAQGKLEASVTFRQNYAPFGRKKT